MADIELGTLPDGGLVQPADLFLVSRGGAGRRVSGARLVLADAAGNAQLGGDPRMAPGAILRAGTAPMIGGDGGANVTLYTGTSALNVRNAANSAALLSLTNGGDMALQGGLAVGGAIRQNGNQVWHAGNLNPSAFVTASTPFFSAPLRAPTVLGFSGSTSDGTTATAAQQVAAGEGSNNPGFRTKLGYWYGSGSWRGVLDVIANNTAAPLDIQPGGGDTLFGGAVRAQVLIGKRAGTGTQMALAGTQPYLSFTTLDEATRFGYLQHTGVGGSFYLNNEQAAGTTILAVAGFETFRVTQSSASVTGALGVSGNVGVGGTLNAANVSVAGSSVWHAGNFTPSSYALRSEDVVFRDVTVRRGTTDTGVVYFGNGQHYIFFNRASNRFDLVIDNTLVATFSATQARFRGDGVFGLGNAI